MSERIGRTSRLNTTCSGNGTSARAGLAEIELTSTQPALSAQPGPSDLVLTDKEINEAFSVVTLFAIREMKLDKAKVNIYGGAAALGHPIGASGARLLTALLYQMRRQDARTGLVSLCLGGGEAVALVLKR